MNVIKPLSFLLAIAFSATAAAKVTLEVPDSIDLLVVNGDKVNTSSGFFSSGQTIELENGESQIVFRFEPLFRENGERNIVESDVVIAKFSAEDKELTFSLPSFRNQNEARQTIDEVNWTLMDENNQVVELKQDKLKKNGMQLGRDYVQEAQEYNLTGAIAAVETHLPASTIQMSEASATSAAEEMLHFWYSKADEATKARFKQFVNAQ